MVHFRALCLLSRVFFDSIDSNTPSAAVPPHAPHLPCLSLLWLFSLDLALLLTLDVDGALDDEYENVSVGSRDRVVLIREGFSFK